MLNMNQKLFFTSTPSHLFDFIYIYIIVEKSPNSSHLYEILLLHDDIGQEYRTFVDRRVLNHNSNHPRMCVMSTLRGKVDKHSPIDIYIYVCVCVCVRVSSKVIFGDLETNSNETVSREIHRLWQYIQANPLLTDRVCRISTSHMTLIAIIYYQS